MPELDPELVDNYRTLAEGEAVDSILARLDDGDPTTAAQLRKAFGTKRTAAPVDRSASPPSSTTDDEAPAPRKRGRPRKVT